MKAQIRYDSGELLKPVELPNGYIRCDARLTRVGVFDYATPQGIRRELRLPEEVFKNESLSTFSLAPVTIGHPKQDGEHVFLDLENTRKFQTGVASDIRQDNEFMAGSLTITDASAISAAKSGKKEISLGYRCDLEDKSGTTKGIEGIPDGLKFDAIQRNIVGNHVAILDRGRAGRDSVLRIDSFDGIMTSNEIRTGETPKSNKQRDHKMKFDGVEYDASEQVDQVFVKLTGRLDSLQSDLKESSTLLEQANARADKAAEDLEAEKKSRADESSPEKIKEAVQARIDLEREASKILGDEIKVDGMTKEEIQKAVVLKVSPAAESKLDGANEVYLQARYDQAVEGSETPAHTPNNQVQKVDNSDESTQHIDSDDARTAMIKRNAERSKSAK